MILSAEAELKVAEGNAYPPLNNLRRAFSYVVKALALKEGLPEAKESLRDGKWTYQQITRAVMRLSDEMPVIKELWLKLNQTTEINVDEVINKI